MTAASATRVVRVFLLDDTRELRLRVRGKHVARRCFIATPTKLSLPAFGALTGGLDATHPEISRAVGNSAEALIPVADRMLRFPLAA